QMFSKTFEDDLTIKDHKDMVIVKDIDMFSYCEHHMALMYDMKAAVAYIPNNKVLGLSKIARICDMVGKRLQLQERIGSDIADIIMEVAECEDVAVYIEGCHSCMSAKIGRASCRERAEESVGAVEVEERENAEGKTAYEV